MPITAAIHGTFFCFAAAVLLVFVSVSVPVWDNISFLNVDATRNGFTFTFKYGVFGVSGSAAQIGYTFPGQIINNELIFNDLTKALILHPIAAGLSAISALFGLCGAGYSRAGSVIMTFFAALAAITTIVIWVIDMVLFTLVRSRFNDQGFAAQYGNALWLTLGALVALLLGFCAGACGICASRSRRDGSPISNNVWWRNRKFINSGFRGRTTTSQG